MNPLDHEIFRRRMVHDDGRGGLFGVEKKAAGQVHAHGLLRVEKLEELRLVLEVRARRITERISRAPILLMKQVADSR